MDNQLEVYVVLTDTGTLFTRTIKYFTKDPLNHASIALDNELNEVYSFGRKNPSNPFIGGFVKENMRGQLFRNAACAVYRCKVTQAEYAQMKLQIEHMEMNQALYRYNFIGIFAVLFNIQMKREYAYFCSQFVASVFERSGVYLTNKSPQLVRPGDFPNTPLLEMVYQGPLQAYILSIKQKNRLDAGESISA